MKLNTKILATALLLIGSTSFSYAAHVVLPGTSTVPLFTAAPLGGTLVDQASTYINNLAYSGWARAAVYNVGGYLDFYYQYQADPLSKHGIERLATFDFTGFKVTAFETNAAFGIFTAGTTAADSIDRDITGGVVGTNYLPNDNGKIDPGDTSYTVILRTDATKYTLGSLGIINGFASNAAAFAPAVPEPETYAMILAGLGLLGAARRFKKTKSE